MTTRQGRIATACDRVKIAPVVVASRLKVGLTQHSSQTLSELILFANLGVLFKVSGVGLPPWAGEPTMRRSNVFRFGRAHFAHAENLTAEGLADGLGDLFRIAIDWVIDNQSLDRVPPV
jgi:hypothetical protein